MEVELIGRDEELQHVQRFLGAVPDGARALLIEGEAGVGKTVLWEAALGRARDVGLRVIAARPTEAETSFAHAGLGDLVGSHPEALEDLPGPQRRALEAALMVADGSDALDQQAVALATLAALRALARETPLVVAVDDVQWLDRPTAAVLAFAARRLTDDRIGLLLALRTPGAEPAPLGPRPAARRRAPRTPVARPAQPRRGPAPPAAPARLGPVTPGAPSRSRPVGREPVLRARAGPRAPGGLAARWSPASGCP